MKALLLIGRILFSSIFVMAIFNFFTPPEFADAASHGLQNPGWLVIIADVLSVLGGFSVALGLKARWGAWLLILSLIPVTVVMHTLLQFIEPTDRVLPTILIMKNVALLGGALIIAYFGSGAWSLDQWLRKDRRKSGRREVDRVIEMTAKELSRR
jgi:putative oxidoreductase